MNTTTAAKATPRKAYRLPKGYEAAWPKPGHDLLKRTASAKGSGPAWYVTCNAHGDMTAAGSAKEAEALGTEKARATWCSGDHKPAPKKATAKKATAKKATVKKAPGGRA